MMPGNERVCKSGQSRKDQEVEVSIKRAWRFKVDCVGLNLYPPQDDHLNCSPRREITVTKGCIEFAHLGKCGEIVKINRFLHDKTDGNGRSSESG